MIWVSFYIIGVIISIIITWKDTNNLFQTLTSGIIWPFVIGLVTLLLLSYLFRFRK